MSPKVATGEEGILDPTPKPGDYAAAGKMASLQLEISLHKDIIGKPLHVKEAILDESLRLQSALISLLERPGVHRNDIAEVREHIEQLKDLASHALTAPTVVGVMGTTGSGKSSLMNALFGEKLFPVSGTRACTAAITEISYNKRSCPYRAVIEFVSLETWRAELELLFADINTAKDDVGSSEKDDKNSPANSAYAKISKVYPFITRANLHAYTIDQLLSLRAVKSVLGKRVKIQEQTASEFYQQLQQYVDSGEPLENGDDTTTSTQMRLWPLVDVAKVYLKHWILKTGVTLVDIPGGHDHNAARARSAAKYAGRCSAYLMVSKVHRAAADGYAMGMMGDAFRRQLRFDSGSLNDSLVTFVCTQADVVDFPELKDVFSAKVEEHLKAYDADHQGEQQVQQVMSDLEIELNKLMKKQEQAQRNTLAATKQCKKLRDRLKDLSPDAGSKSADQTIPRKRKVDELDNAMPELDLASEKEALELDIAEQTCIADQCSELEEEYGSQALEVQQHLKQLQSQHLTAASHRDPTAILNAMCIRAMAETVEVGLRKEVITDIRRIDDELRGASGKVPEDLEDVRDYTRVWKDLPVFVVSSKAFQVMSGQKQDDKDAIRGFLDIKDTKIPALQKHCASLTFRARAMTCERALTQTDLVLLSIIMWTGHGGTRQVLTPKVAKKKQAICKGLLDNLVEDLERLTVEVNDAMQKCLRTLGQELHSAARVAKEYASNIVRGWHGTNSYGKALYKWNTYKAICARNGSYREQNWNESLAKPLEEILVVPWTRCFTGEDSAMAEIVSSFLQKCVNAFNYHGRLLLQAVRTLGPTAHGMFNQQIQASLQAIMLLNGQVHGEIALKQQELNRLTIPSIETSMKSVYQNIAQDSGTGIFARSKRRMEIHIDGAGSTMYKTAVREIYNKLEEMPTQISNSMLRKLRGIHHHVQNDCNQLLTPISDEQFKWREDIYDTICKHKPWFQAILDEACDEQTTGMDGEDAGVDTSEVNDEDDVEDTDDLFV